jgi:hypothetical protein
MIALLMFLVLIFIVGLMINYCHIDHDHKDNFPGATAGLILMSISYVIVLGFACEAIYNSPNIVGKPSGAITAPVAVEKESK